MEDRYKRIFEDISGFLKQTKKAAKPKPRPPIDKERSFGAAFATAMKTGAKTFIWKNPHTGKTRTYNTKKDE